LRVNIIQVICRYYFLVQFNNNLWWVPFYWIKSSRTEREAVLPNKLCRCILVINTLWCIKHRPLICNYACDWLYRNSTRFVTTTVSDYSGRLESRLRLYSGQFADMFVTNTSHETRDMGYICRNSKPIFFPTTLRWGIYIIK